jgi:hypothetical protein
MEGLLRPLVKGPILSCLRVGEGQRAYEVWPTLAITLTVFEPVVFVGEHVGKYEPLVAVSLSNLKSLFSKYLCIGSMRERSSVSWCVSSPPLS